LPIGYGGRVGLICRIFSRCGCQRFLVSISTRLLKSAREL
jgi:hypothetical protein